MQMADQIVLRSVESLIPYARNARTHSDAQVAQIAGSIREFGFTSPVLIDGEHGIVARHGRVLAARKLGLERVLAGVTPHLMVTDPPYGVNYDPAWRNEAKFSDGDHGGRALGKVVNDDRADWCEAWARFPGDVVYVWHAGDRAATAALVHTGGNLLARYPEINGIAELPELSPLLRAASSGAEAGIYFGSLERCLPARLLPPHRGPSRHLYDSLEFIRDRKVP